MEKHKTLWKRLFTFWIPFIILLSYVFLALEPDLQSSIPVLVGISAIVTVVLSIALYGGETGLIKWSSGMIIFIALLLRILFIFRPPELSDDIYRYLWDGLQTIHGNNPYAYAPADHVRYSDAPSESLLGHINHPHLVTIYPPAAQVVFATGALLFKSVIGIKLILAFVDLLTCLLIMKILTIMRLPAWRSVLYAWHPIPIIEIAGSGHIDGAGTFFLFVTVTLILSASSFNRGKIISRIFAGMTYGASLLVKLFPIVFIACFLGVLKGSQKIQFFIGIIVAVVLLAVPFMPELNNMLGTLIIYIRNWEFSNFAFRTLRNLTSSGDIARFTLAFLFLIAASISTFLFLKKSDHHRKDVKNYISNETTMEFFRSIYAITMAFLFLTPTLHPWYLLSLVCLFPFTNGPAGIILSWSVFLSYYVLIDYSLLGQWVENDVITASIWGAPATAFLLNRLMKRISGSQSAPSHVPRPPNDFSG